MSYYIVTCAQLLSRPLVDGAHAEFWESRAQSLSFGFVLDFSSVSGHVYRSVFYFRVRTRNVLVELFHFTSPCVCHGWVVGRILVNFRDFKMKRKLVEK